MPSRRASERTRRSPPGCARSPRPSTRPGRASTWRRIRPLGGIRALMKGLVALGLFWGGLGLACLAAGCSNDAGPAVPVDPAVMYAQNCARCHGADGKGDPDLKKTLPVRDFSVPLFLVKAQPDDLARTIMAGKGQM